MELFQHWIRGTSNGITIPGSMLYVEINNYHNTYSWFAVSFALGFTFTYLFGYDGFNVRYSC